MMNWTKLCFFDLSGGLIMMNWTKLCFFDLSTKMQG